MGPLLEPGSSAQLIVGYASYEPYIKGSDGWLAKVCQVSLLALKMDWRLRARRCAPQFATIVLVLRPDSGVT